MDKRDEIMKGCEHDGSYIPVNEVRRLMDEYAEWLAEQAFNAGKDFQFNYDDRKNHWDEDAPDYPEWLENIKKQHNG